MTFESLNNLKFKTLEKNEIIRFWEAIVRQVEEQELTEV